MKEFAAGVLTTLIVLVAVFYLYFATGMAPVAASEKPMPFEKKLAHLALHARLDREMPTRVPLPPDEQNLTAVLTSTWSIAQSVTAFPIKNRVQLPKVSFRLPHIF